MEELKAFLYGTDPRNSQVTKLRAPLTGGMCVTKDDTLHEMNRKAEHRSSVVPRGTDYARQVRERETNMYVRNQIEFHQSSCSVSGGLESLEHLTSVGASLQNLELTDEALTEVYTKYSFQKQEDTHKLPIYSSKADILDRLNGYRVVIIQGPTGCGKTTQVPQWILDEHYRRREPCKVIVTQPRRIAAISIAKRVAQERGWDVGGLVGYQVGLDNKTSADTRITYVTTGILLQKLVASKTLNEYTHIILDEVHERGQEMDFLLLIIKKLLFTVSPKTSIVLMSATFNSQQFLQYFLLPNTLQLPNCDVVKVDDRPDQLFTVKIFYLDDLDKFGSSVYSCITKDNAPGIQPEMHQLVVRLLNAFEAVDADEDKWADRAQADLPSALVFLPGIHEIEDLYHCLTDTDLRARVAGAACARWQWWVVPLHSTITADEQARVFQRAPPGHRKIILATNIAESSITVPDIKYVIDYCLMKSLVADESTNFTSLQLSWAARANCDQRRGRAGRVRDGRVYRLVTKKHYATFPAEAVPEMVRCPLERLVLLAKMLDAGPPADILALALHPPDLSNIHRTMLVLKEVGALKKTLNEEWCAEDGDITYMGRVMARLPLDVRVSKLIILGYIFGVLEEAVIMAACMSVKSVFSSPFRERLTAYNSKLTWADGSTSDCIAFLNVYKVWQHLKQQNYFKQSGTGEAQWARRFYVQARALREAADLVRELRARLAREGLDDGHRPSPWARHELPLALKIIIAGAFYPHYFIQAAAHQDRERDAVKALAGRDPRNTVYLKNFPDKQPGEVYAAAIRSVIKQHVGDEPQVTFDSNSRKVFLTFGDDDEPSARRDNDSGNPSIPGQVVLPVYKCVKARQLKMDITIPLLPVEQAASLAAARPAPDLERCVPRLPDIDETIIPVRITQLVSVSKFWVVHDDESTANLLRAMDAALNGGPLVAHTGPVAPGDLLAGPAPHAPHTPAKLLRVRVTKVLPRDVLEVHYIDVGSYGRVSALSVRVLPATCGGPPLALRCRLAAAAPAPLLDPHAAWTGAAYRFFTDIVAKGNLLAKVYSVVDGVVAMELLAEGGRRNVNHELLQRGHAVPAEEAYDSKLNHEVRAGAAKLNMAQRRAYNREQAARAYTPLGGPPPPRAADCTAAARLVGPHSPLESCVHAVMFASREKRVHIEGSSVNSVLLDTDPQQTFDRLVVAGHVGQSESGAAVTLRHTTVLPNIPGLAAAAALLFCPAAELRAGAAGWRYAAALCGLGGGPDGAPRFPEHDLLLNIDADFTLDDIGLINHIRHLMEFMVQCGEGQEAPARDHTTLAIPKLIRSELMQLLTKRRVLRPAEAVAGAWQWRRPHDRDLLELSDDAGAARAALYPLHRPPALRPRDAAAARAAARRLRILLARSGLPASERLTCEVCGSGALPPHDMRLHVLSTAHQLAEDDLGLEPYTDAEE